MDLKIRKAISTDLNNLAVLKQQVWISTYATEGLKEEFSSYALSAYSVGNVRKLISDKNKLILIATIDDCVVGCAEILLSPKRLITSKDPCLEISTLYVLERFQGVGIGEKLLSACIKAIEQLNYNKIWLTVYCKNKRPNHHTAGQLEYNSATVAHKVWRPNENKYLKSISNAKKQSASKPVKGIKRLRSSAALAQF